MKRFTGYFLLLVLSISAGWAADFKVVTLHPLLADLARQVGGDHVEVVELMGPDADPHAFEPSPRDLQAARDADLYLLVGKGFETYRPKLASIVGEEKLMDVGERLPTLKAEVPCDHDGHAHVHLEDDPHWWHSLDCWRRAARHVAKRFGEVDPERKEVYATNGKEARSRFAKLHKWAKAELGQVPPERRILATAHAAFAYLCNEHEWKMLPVQGVNRQQVASPKFVGEVAETLRKEGIGVIFPEKRSNPKTLAAIAETAGLKVGKPLIADGSGSIEGMFRHNVNAIVAAMGPDPK